MVCARLNFALTFKSVEIIIILLCSAPDVKGFCIISSFYNKME